jgi:thioredoxin-like negative regulator of GroEL
MIKMLSLPEEFSHTHKSVRTLAPALLFVHVPWCSYCKSATPIMKKVAATLGTAVPTYAINADEMPHIAKSLKVTSYPSIFYVSRRGGIAKFERERSVDTIVGWVCELSSRDGGYSFCGKLL